MSPGALQLNQSVSTNVSPANQPVRPGASQNTPGLPSGSILRQLMPTGKQVIGIPTSTLAPASVTLCLQEVLPLSPLPQMPTQLPCAVSSSGGFARSGFAQASPSVAEANQALKQAKKWKTCPVCNELFPSNVSQVPMEVAHNMSPVNPNPLKIWSPTTWQHVHHL